MFQLFDRTRRGIAILLFCVLGPGLTTTVAVAVVRRHLPSAARNASERLSSWFRSPVTIKRSVPLRPGETVYHELEMPADSVTGASCLFCREVHITRHFIGSPPTGNSSSSENDGGSASKKLPGIERSYLSVYIPEIMVDSKQAKRIPVLLDELLSGSAPANIPVILNVDQLRFLSSEQREPPVADMRYSHYRNEKNHTTPPSSEAAGHLFRVTELQAIFLKGESRSWAKISFHMPDIASEEPVAFRVIRDRKEKSIETVFSLSTADATLPCPLAALFCESFATFGNGRFRGRLTVRKGEHLVSSQEDRSSVQLENFDVQNVDFGRLASGVTSYPIKGKVSRFGVQSALIVGGRLQRATGWFDASDGSLPARLLKQFVDALSLSTEPENVMPATELPVPFDRLIVYFHFDPTGSTFWSSHPSGLLLRTGNQFALYQSGAKESLPYTSLLQILSPKDTPSIPLTRHSERWLRHLPVTTSPSIEVSTEGATSRHGFFEEQRNAEAMINALRKEESFVSNSETTTQQGGDLNGLGDETMPWPQFEHPILQAGFQSFRNPPSRGIPRLREPVDTAEYSSRGSATPYQTPQNVPPDRLAPPPQPLSTTPDGRTR